MKNQKSRYKFLNNFFKYINFSLNEYKPTAVKSMPKPPPHNYPQQPHPAPYAAPPQPNGSFFKWWSILFVCLLFIVTHKPPPSNVNIQGAPGSGNRAFKKGNKGSASLNRNENTNQIAVCYACGVKIR
jgi:hypothetical protein